MDSAPLLLPEISAGMSQQNAVSCFPLNRMHAQLTTTYGDRVRCSRQVNGRNAWKDLSFEDQRGPSEGLIESIDPDSERIAEQKER
jgi:hypothetical protein